MDQMMECCVPPGFRFHPTEEELVGYYLNRKVNSLKIDLDVITDVDLYRIEPWDIQERCKLGYEEQNEWYFFSHKDRKYPTGTRTNRATAAGFWKATGRDKAVLSKDKIIGMRKTLVFYKGRAPNGNKTHWIMHEYRRQSSEHAPTQEEGWVVCRAFKKPTPNNKPAGIFHQGWNNHHNNSYYLRHNNINSHMPTTTTLDASNNTTILFNHHQIGTNLIPQFPFTPPHHQDHSGHLNNHGGGGGGGYDQINQLVELPQLDSPTKDREDVDKNNYGGGDQSWNNNNNLDYKLMNDDHQVLPSYSSFANMPPLLIRDDLLECLPDF